MFGGIVFGGVPFAAVAVPLQMSVSASISMACVISLATPATFSAASTISVGTEISFSEPLRARATVSLASSAKLSATELLRATLGVQTITNFAMRHQKYSRLPRPHFTIEAELDGYQNGWTFVEDVIIGTTSFQRGLPGIRSTDFIASTGQLSFTLDNSEFNSQRKLGLYTPGHANALPGWINSIGIRCVMVIRGEPFVQWTGRLLNIKTSTGVYGERRVRCMCVDYMDQMARKRLVNLPLQVDATDSDVFRLIVAEMPTPPRALQVDQGFDTLHYAFDTMKAEYAVPTSEVARLCKSTLRRCYVKKDGTLTFESRSLRAQNTAANVVTLTPADFMLDAGPEIEDNRDILVNRVQTTLHPRKTGETADVVLFALEGKPLVQAAYPFSIRGFYTEPGNLARRAGGLDMLPAVPHTDYVFNVAEDGSGVDVTLQVAVATIYTANSVLFQIESPINCYCIKLQARGTAVVDQANIITEASDETSISHYGENNLSLDMPYQGDVAFGQEVVQYLLFLEQQTSKRVKEVTMLLDGKEPQRQKLLVQREISDRVGVVEPMNNLPTHPSEGHFINRIAASEDADGLIFLTWALTLADATQYWYLEIPGFSELDYTTRLGFGLVIGHTDVEHSDQHANIVHSDVAHNDEHGDVTHQDAAHSDVTHTDVPHSNVAHSDVAHSNAHGDQAHADVPQENAHSNVAHNDVHTNVPHTNQAHEDIAYKPPVSSHDDVYTNTPHSDAYTNATYGSGAGADHYDYYVNEHTDHHQNSHIDDGGNPHYDVPHYDGAHNDVHTNVDHQDSHSNVNHQDVPYASWHTDVAHTNVAHADYHEDTGHGDAQHGDISHVNNHTDVSHSDVAHQDSHGDTAHGDKN